ncbi:uncharacterized protein LOC143295979 isoform X2 [Babylonia areolata]|uniref:uncharacterized protein LOC143295979 isoform X2 n=1 Tax=Babylonia areolata TaxID=304850 RepID=UPI003FD53468
MAFIGYISRLYDVGDYEWVVYSTHLCWCLLPIICVHIIVSRLLSRVNQRSLVKKLVYVTIGAAATCYLLQWRFLTLLIVTTVVFYVASTLHSLPVVWGLALLLIYACNSYARSVTDLLGVSASEDYFTAIYVWASVCLRCTCFAIERVWSLHANTTADSSPSSLSSTSSSSSSSSAAEVSSAECTQHANAESRLFSSTEIYSRNKGKCALNCDEQKSYVSVSSPGKPNGCGGDTARKYVYDWPVLSKVPGFLDALVYVFYVPLLFNGPPITFKSFKEQIENPSCLCENGYSHVVWKFCRVCFWFCFNNVMFHYVFFAAFGEDTATIQDADKWTLATTAYLIGQFMTNKYVVIYGAMTQTARLDGLALADNPVCISYIYAYSDMWKSFDRGLYSCLKRYIYIPLGGSQSGVLRSEVALLGTFWFMGYWHGGQYRYMMWALLNYVEVGLENIGAALQRSLLVQKHLQNVSSSDETSASSTVLPAVFAGHHFQHVLPGGRSFRPPLPLQGLPGTGLLSDVWPGGLLHDSERQTPGTSRTGKALTAVHSTAQCVRSIGIPDTSSCPSCPVYLCETHLNSVQKNHQGHHYIREFCVVCI